MKRMNNVISLLFFILSFFSITSAQQLTIAEKVEDLRGPVILDEAGRLWFTGPDKIMSYENDKWVEHNVPGTLKYLWTVTGMREPLPMAEDAEGNIWTVAKEGFLEYNGSEWKLHPYDKNSFDVTITIFAAEHGPVVFQNLKGQIAIYDKGKWINIAKDLPGEITRIAEYGNNILLGNREKVKEVGVYNGTYKLITEGKEFNYFKCILESSVIIDIDKKAGQTNLFVIPLDVKEDIYMSRVGESGFLMLYPDRLEIESNSKVKTISIPADYQKLMKNRDAINDFQEINGYYYIATEEGLIKFKEGAFEVLGSSKGLGEDKAIRLKTDYDGNLMVFHEKSLSMLIDGKWKVYNKSNGFDFDFKGFHRTYILKNDNKIYVVNCLTQAIGGNANICIYENGKWSTLTKKIKYEEPVISEDNKLWFYDMPGSKIDGVCYFENNAFTTFCTEDGLENNVVGILEPVGKNIWVTTYSIMNGKSFVHRLVFK